MATTPVFLPGEFHGQKSLMGYSPWGLKELDITEQLTHTHFSISSLISPWNGLVHLTRDSLCFLCLFPSPG